MTKEEQLKNREALDEVLNAQLTVAIKALSNCDAAAIGSGLAKTILHYVQDLSKELGVPSHGYFWVPGEEPKYGTEDEDEAPTPSEPTKETIEDMVATEAEAVLGKTETAAEEQKVETTKTEPTATTYTKEEVTNILRGLQLKYSDQTDLIEASLKEFGATRLSQVSAEKYGELVAAAKAKVGET